ncbi:MAG: transglutaminase domain-containing protein [Lachnospiraceae bacterium]|jgi:transglutaminase-like putative cysteine protease|nr:transglutaminase domain-containing protein [Lachnospiraceae bacterium]
MNRNENENDWITWLSLPLPEDVMKHKWHGDFAAMEQAMDRRLSGGLSDGMRKRLLLEKKIIKRLPGNYPLDREDACKKLEEAVEGFRPEELKKLMDEDCADWIYIGGEPHFRDNLLENLFKTRPDYAARRRKEQEESREKGFLSEAIENMRTEGGMDLTIRLRARLWFAREAACRPGETVRVWLPIPAVGAQVKAVRILDDGTGTLPRECLYFVHTAPESAPQRTICWEVSWQPGLEFLVEYEYDIEAGYVDLWGEDGKPAFRQSRYACFDAVTRDDLAEQPPHIVFSPMIRSLTNEVVGEETRPLEKARRIYDYVTKKIRYSFMRSYVTLPVISEYVAAGGKGDCGAQSILFIAMCRCAGIPARWQSGLYANPGRVGNHDWARFYVEEYGWLYADCSFGGGAHRAGDESRRRFYFGNLDPYRMPSCNRFQTDFDPVMRRLRSDPFDAQSGEAELTGEEHERYPFESETVITAVEER